MHRGVRAMKTFRRATSDKFHIITDQRQWDTQSYELFSLVLEKAVHNIKLYGYKESTQIYSRLWIFKILDYVDTDDIALIDEIRELKVIYNRRTTRRKEHYAQDWFSG